jgi:hypothetical protein
LIVDPAEDARTMKRSLFLSLLLILARFRFGRIFLHLLAMAGDGALRFHFGGIARELFAWRTH